MPGNLGATLGEGMKPRDNSFSQSVPARPAQERPIYRFKKRAHVHELVGELRPALC